MVRYVVSAGLWWGGMSAGQAQDLFDYAHSRRFAEHLANAGQFDAAAREYERLVFLRPGNDTLNAQLLNAYRRGRLTEQGLLRAAQLYPHPARMPGPAVLELGRLHLQRPDYRAARRVWADATTLPPAERAVLTATADALAGRFAAALAAVQPLAETEHPLAGPYQTTLAGATRLRPKSPALAGVLSAVVPGTGRVYARDWRDGVVSLVFISAAAWQSYRGFRLRGAESVRGWVFGGVSLGFYLGNVYGSVQSARQYNRRQQDRYRHAIERLFTEQYP